MLTDYIKCGGCLELMEEIPDESIDMILCDLPYGATKNTWDIVISIADLWKQYKRVIKKNGAIVLFSNGLFMANLMRSNQKMWRYNLVWDKVLTSGFLNANRQPLRSHEEICVFYKKQPIYNPQFTEGQPLHGMGYKYREKTNANNNYNDFASNKNPSAYREGDTKKHPKSILEFQRPASSVMLHPTQKPVELLEYLIKTYTNEGALVLDNCMGSGSTCVAAINTGRHYIGYEIEKKYYDIAEQRINEAKKKKEVLC